MLGLLCFCALFGQHVATIISNGVIVNGGGGLCNSTTAKANGTGVVSFDPDFYTQATYNGGIWLPNPSWLLTVSTINTGAVESHFWFNTGGKKYWDDVHTLFDACAFIIGPGLNPNTIRLGQNDPGDCSIMLQAPCRHALTHKAASLAYRATRYASPPPYSNLSTGDLPTICQQIALDFDSPDPSLANLRTFPKECYQDFNIDPNYQVVALTSNNRSTIPSTFSDVNVGTAGLDFQCPTQDESGKQFYSTFGFRGNSYRQQMNMATPILTVFFSVANEEAESRQSIVPFASAHLACPRVTNVTAGSYKPSPLPSGTPYPVLVNASIISHKALIGVAVGVAAMVVLIALVIGVIWVRSSRQRKVDDFGEDALNTKADQPKSDAIELDQTGRIELSPLGRAAELNPRSRKPEIDGTQILEAEVTLGAVELDTVRRWSFDSSRPSISSYATAAS